MMSPSEESPITTTMSDSDSSYHLNYRMPIPPDGNGRRKIRTDATSLLDFLHKLVLSAKENHSIELLMFFHMIGYTCTTVIVQNLYIDRICRLGREFDPELCKNLTQYPKEELLVEQDASYYTMYRSIVEALIPVLFALFLGPFVDRNGSKVPILLCLFGYTVASLMYVVFSLIPSIPAAYLLFCSIPISLTGGLVAFLMSAFTLISNRSTVENRSFRIAVLEGCWFLGVLGFLVASKIYKSYGFVPVFLVSAACFAIALLYGFYYIEEPHGKSIQNAKFERIFREIFDLRSVKDTLLTVSRRRQGSVRTWVILLMITVFLRMLALQGAMQVGYLYTRNKFQWDTEAFSKFTTSEAALSLIGGLVTLTAMKLFNISDAVIGLFSAAGFVMSNMCFASAGTGPEYGWVMYFAAVLQMFAGLITIVLRSMVSKCVAKDELAKAFSFVSIGEACMPILAGLLFNPLYSHTVSTFPGAVFFLSALLHGFILLNFIYFYFATRGFPFSSLSEEQ